ncbi:hypothetical protein [Thauera humireducens]|uniref:Uncharacterized protein n=1 Tax=Thauera humireducens TaxID=1134435 RepID=A0A127K3J8_9RHOO|nr:hypothetical protein [Thauera humireducens]AMO36529.1 hypothetical protein AC731_006005 [Thauera humireducens]
MIRIDVSDNIKEVTKQLDDLARRQVPFATSRAINETAKIVAKEGNAVLASVFDSPLPRTATAVKVFQGATKERLFAVVNVYDGNRGFAADDPRATSAGKGSIFPNRYLSAQIEGGQRANKRFENALIKAQIMPPGMQAVFAKRSGYLDPFGNLPGAKINQILSWFNAFDDGKGKGYRSNMTDKTRTAATMGRKNRRTGDTSFGKGRKYGFAYFVSRGERFGGLGMRLPPGIWERNYPNGPAGKSFIKPVLLFVRPGNYRRRFDFYGLMQRSIEKNLPEQLEKAMAMALRTAR